MSQDHEHHETAPESPPGRYVFTRWNFPPRLGPSAALVAAVLALSVGNPARAADGPETEILQKNKLKASGSIQVLEAEAEFKTKLTQARQLSYSLMRQQGTLSPQQYQHTLQQLRNEVNEMKSEISLVNQQMSRLPRSRGRLVNNLVQEQYAELLFYRNQLQAQVSQESTLLNQLQRQKADPKAKEKTDAEVRDRREAYHQSLMDLRTLADATTQKYEDLAQDDEVKKAIDTLGKGKRDKPRLGPSHNFSNNVKLLEKLEKAESAAVDNPLQAKPSRRSRSGSKSRSSARANSPSAKPAENAAGPS